MADVITRPVNDSPPPPAPETIKAPMHSRDEVMEQVRATGTPIAEEYLPKKADLSEVFDSDESGLWKATRALKKAHEAAGGGIDDNPPIIERKYKDRDK